MYGQGIMLTFKCIKQNYSRQKHSNVKAHLPVFDIVEMAGMKAQLQRSSMKRILQV